MKKTVVFGASPNPQRYSYIATQMLQDADVEVVPLGIRKGQAAGLDIILEWPSGLNNIHAYMLSLKPKRIIFNPGTENPELSVLASLQGIEVVETCTLVMLRTGQY